MAKEEKEEEEEEQEDEEDEGRGRKKGHAVVVISRAKDGTTYPSPIHLFHIDSRVYIYIYIARESQTSLRAQFIAKRGEPPAGSQSEPVHGTRTDLLLSFSLRANCHN